MCYFQVYGYTGQRLYIDLTHELTVNTLEEEGEIPCNSTFDWIYDDCIQQGIREKLNKEFGCVVPYLPVSDDIRVCSFDGDTDEGKKNTDLLVEEFDYLSSNGQRQLCPR